MNRDNVAQLLSRLENVQLHRIRENQFMRGSQRYEVPLDRPLERSTGWNTLVDYLYLTGVNRDGKSETHTIGLFSPEELTELRESIQQVDGPSYKRV
jgi:hypothetical protein